MRILLSALLLFACPFAFAEDDVPLQNWPVPSASPHRRVQSNGDITNATAFIAVTPCRVVDTRFAVGAFIAGESRTYDISAGPCSGIPPAPAAYSLNFTVLSYNTATGGHIVAYRTGDPVPSVSTVNFGSGPPVANAAIITAVQGEITVRASGATHLIIDVNGYFIGANETMNPNKTFTIRGDVPNGGVVVGQNETTTAGAYTAGVTGTITGLNLSDGAGVMGHTATGPTWGVKGLHTSTVTNGGGVLGISGARPVSVPMNPAGVRGESQNAFGVIGQTASAAGVGGLFHDAQGAIARAGYLANDTYAVYAAGDLAATGTKNFVEPHPTDPQKVVRFAALEGPEAGTYFRGRGKFVRGRAVIDVPEAFRITTEQEGLTVHLTPIGGLALVGVTRQSLDRIEVEASRDVEFSYIVYGVRRGYKDFQPIAEGREFAPSGPGATLPAYLNESQKQRLIDNGTYNSDGTVNLETAIRLGWEKGWEQR